MLIAVVKSRFAGFNTIETVLPYAAEVWSDENEKSYTNYLPDSDEYAKWVWQGSVMALLEPNRFVYQRC